jgi:PadR family transcriptional regulator PadR
VLLWKDGLAVAKIDLPQGTLDLLVLGVLSAGEMHGWGIAQRLGIVSKDTLQLQEGTLYPALYRMEAKGWITSEWASSENNRRAKYYRLTRVGRRQLGAQRESWDRLSAVIAQVMPKP